MKAHRFYALLTAVCTGLSLLSMPFSANAYEFRTTSDYYYHQFDANAKALYDQLLLAAETVDQSSETFLTAPDARYSGLNADQLHDLVFMFMYDHPEYFWIANSYHYGYDWNGNYVRLNVYSEYQNGADRQAARAQFVSTAQGYIDRAMQYDTDYDRSKYLSEQLYHDIAYQTGSLDQSAASALLQKKTVCAGFTKAYSLLANACDVDTISYIGIGHGWNATKIAGNWYHDDVTNALFLYHDDQIAAFDKRVGYYTATYSDGSTVQYLMHDLDYKYYTGIFPDTSKEYNGEKTVLSGEPAATEPPVETTAPAVETTAVTTPQTTTATTRRPRETTSTTRATTTTWMTTTTTLTIPPETTTTTPVSDSERFHVTNKTAYYMADDNTPFDVSALVEKVEYVIKLGSQEHLLEVSDLGSLLLPSDWSTPAKVFANAASDGCFHGQIPVTYLDKAINIGDVWIVQRGDFDGNGVTNAADGAEVLVYAAALGSGETPRFPDGVDPEVAAFAAKLTSDSTRTPNASDAAEILILAARIGSGSL